jgi:hypothetical protein
MTYTRDNFTECPGPTNLTTLACTGTVSIGRKYSHPTHGAYYALDWRGFTGNLKGTKRYGPFDSKETATLWLAYQLLQS